MLSKTARFQPAVALTKQVPFRLKPSFLAKLDAHAEKMSARDPEEPKTRADALRELVQLGLEAYAAKEAAEASKPAPKASKPKPRKS